MKLFIDTWGWIEMRDSRGQHHFEAKQFYQSFRQQKGHVFTTDYVLDETITLLFRRLPFAQADTSLKFIHQAISDRFLHLELITQTRFDQAIEWRRKYKDKPRISFTDLTSMVVMSELGVVDVLTQDDHFIQVGLGFNKVP